LKGCCHVLDEAVGEAYPDTHSSRVGGVDGVPGARHVGGDLCFGGGGGGDGDAEKKDEEKERPADVGAKNAFGSCV
jgi:hypothetical protein